MAIGKTFCYSMCTTVYACFPLGAFFLIDNTEDLQNLSRYLHQVHTQASKLTVSKNLIEFLPRNCSVDVESLIDRLKAVIFLTEDRL